MSGRLPLSSRDGPAGAVTDSPLCNRRYRAPVGVIDEAGFDVTYDQEDGVVWASLVRRSNPTARVPKYGRGETEAEALASAERRWQVEQIGSPADQQSNKGQRRVSLRWSQ